MSEADLRRLSLILIAAEMPERKKCALEHLHTGLATQSIALRAPEGRRRNAASHGSPDALLPIHTRGQALLRCARFRAPLQSHD